jgi:hypothetical protein
MPERGNALSRNPNTCASCSSLVDGLDESQPPLRHSIAPPRPFSTVSCNLSRRFPLYGVEAGGLPAKAAQRKELNVDKTLKLSL